MLCSLISCCALASVAWGLTDPSMASPIVRREGAVHGDLRFAEFLASADLLELLPMLKSEGIASLDDMLHLNEADIADFAQRRHLRLGMRAALRRALSSVQSHVGEGAVSALGAQMHAQTSHESTTKKAGGAQKHNSVKNHFLKLGNRPSIEAPLEALAGCLSTAGCGAALDTCLAAPACVAKATSAAANVGAPSFALRTSPDELTGSVASISLSLSLVPNGSELASCVMTRAQELAKCMLTRASALPSAAGTEADHHVVDV